MSRKKWVFLVRFAPVFWILVIYPSAYIYQIAASRAFGFLGSKAFRRFSGYPNEPLIADFCTELEHRLIIKMNDSESGREIDCIYREGRGYENRLFPSHFSGSFTRSWQIVSWAALRSFFSSRFAPAPSSTFFWPLLFLDALPRVPSAKSR